MKNNHKGFTVVELLVVVALLAILSVVAGISISTISSSNQRKCANEINALLSQCRVLTLSGASDPVLELCLESDGYYGTISGGGTQYARERLGPAKADVTYTAGGVSYVLAEDSLFLAFDRTTGALRKLDELSGNTASGSCTEIVSGSYTVALTPSTGYHDLVS